MGERLLIRSIVCLGLAAAGCGGEGGGVDGGPRPDAALPDGGAADGATPDGQVPDAAAPDAVTVGCPPDMVPVPAGPFVMGSDWNEGSPDEELEHTVTLSAYCIDETEVTNAAYRACEQAGGCTAPSDKSSYTRGSYYADAEYDSYPVIYVDWAQAAAFCAWPGHDGGARRLPTEAEWEKAARGASPDERTYPWGEVAPTCSSANFGGLPGTGCEGDTAGVGSLSGDSPYGAKDMAGNAWEWVADWRSESYTECGSGCSGTDPQGPPAGTFRVVRGGSWGDDATYLRVANRFYATPSLSSTFVGFRCVRSAL